MKKRIVKKVRLKQKVKDTLMLLLFYIMIAIDVIVFINQL